MKRITIIMLLGIVSLAACSVDELSTAFEEPITDQNGVIIDHYPYLWARSHSADSAGTAARIVFKTPDCSLPMFDNGGKVIVGNVYGGITCLETDGGNVVWTCKLIDNPDVDTSKTIYDFHIASTEEWIIINLSGTRFVKIKLETGEILGLCEPQATASTRMIINGDVMFFININEQVYRVYIEDMECKPFSFFGVFVSTKKIWL